MSTSRPLPPSKLRRLLALVTPLAACLLLTVPAGGARAAAYLPPAHRIFQGVAGQPISEYEQATGKHPAVYQVFAAWGEWLPSIFQDADSAQARLMIHITTASGSQEMITPAQIAAGAGDAWLIALNNAIYASGRITYVRLMAEMDNANNPYSAYDANGSFRGAAHSQSAYIRAWRRATLILRGGPLATIDAQLHKLGMPPLHTTTDLPRPQVSMLWVPMSGGLPDIGGNQPANYWPGRSYVDWIGTDFYSKFPNFAGLNSLYSAYRGFPFVFGEWAMWGGDNPGFVDQLFAWVHAHPRVRMMVYNQGQNPTGPFRLSHYPASAHEIRRVIGSSTFLAYTADWQAAVTAARHAVRRALPARHRPARRH